mgnify:CR=1 FL=1
MHFGVKVDKATPKQFGNLYERFQYLMQLAKRDKDAGHLSDDLWHAIWDLRTEISGYDPVDPPYGRRSVESLQ